jgi:hypothetical protein
MPASNSQAGHCSAWGQVFRDRRSDGDKGRLSKTLATPVAGAVKPAPEQIIDSAIDQVQFLIVINS